MPKNAVEDVGQIDAATIKATYRRRISMKLAATGLTGQELEQKLDELMSRDIGFRFDYSQL